jgi:choline-sulfatase
VRAADAVLGDLLASLEERGLTEDAVVVVVSDHGEHFGEHGLWGHVHGLYEEILQVPFVVAGPGVTPPAPGAPARLIDLAPTALSLAGVDPAAWPALSGRRVTAGVAGEPVVAEQYTPTLFGDPEGLVGDLGALRTRRRSWFDGRFKLHTTERDRDFLFDLDADPREELRVEERAQSRAASAHALEAWAEAEGIEWPDAVGAGPVVDGFAEEALRALGYLD